ncbi:MCD, Malonyl-CoA decarboxylase MCD [Pararhizobium mangrovi]|uniref:MCD, Malonyl-CoA decarboxylase MCD n=2 Tax=Pararhizobium mangrovi TaxID=2590452 RepID=A0A506UD73_9HYPH|nr:MCD, Malonyl-CoA decarboxylase MCD [Pararhizobium mangrovi]
MSAGKNIDKSPKGFLFSELLTSIAERGMSLIDTRRYRREGDTVESLLKLCGLLLTSKGEASGIAMAREALALYRKLDEAQKSAFFSGVLERLEGDLDKAITAAANFVDAPSYTSLAVLNTATRPRCSVLLERLNQAPGGTLSLVRMREDLLDAMASDPGLAALDWQFVKLFSAWFNRGFLELRRIDWNAPADLLEKIMRYEAVHRLDSWDELRRRILPEDRCLYGFFHPRLEGEPLIFVEVALTDAVPESIGTILEREREELSADQATTAVFYSISNCQRGLRGIPLGSFLIKQVVTDLKSRFARLKTFVTLSPLPAYAEWLKARHEAGELAMPAACPDWDTFRAALDDPASDQNAEARRFVESTAAYFLSKARNDSGRIVDPVARFHLGNGASLERVNVLADPSPEAKANALGTMVNYLYAFNRIEENHEKFVNSGTISTSQRISRLANAAPMVHDSR